MKKKISWLRILQDVDEAMNTGGLTEYEMSAEIINRAMIDGGYPTLQSIDEVAAKFHLYVEWHRMASPDEIPSSFPKRKIRRIAAA